ncbi:hypothetical protein FDP41_007718 [Naegleria fowleri]|uniref:HNH domain-containing protein n=1 Tax=Naegleria fowleri TaxID=5763 RepID=A0A6A5C058_NAEFO|nr:uncharacterized protein FDP41_007718 [Naegleria fowleri]KAF0983803.1 hypothetical protein FDP41_007718 [Naegleria fowleri]
MEKQGTQTEGEEKVLDDFKEWVQVHIKKVRLLGAKCAKCEMDFEKLGLAFFILAHVHHIKTDGADQRRSATHILELEDRDEIAAHVNEYTLALEGKQSLELYQCLCAFCHQMVHMEKNARLVLSKEEHTEDREKVEEMFNLQSRFHLIPEIKRRLFGGRDDEK